jgi:hypothetical protein
MVAGFLQGEKVAKQEEGQTRSNPISMIDTGYVKLPVTKAITNQIVNGVEIAEGTYIYKPLFGGETVYSSDPLDISKAAFADAARIQPLITGADLINVANANYSNITVGEGIVRDGRTTAQRSIDFILRDLDAQATSLNTKLHVTSLNRPGNERSAHTYGDAVDLRLIENGQINLQAVDAVKNTVAKLEANEATKGLYTVLIEFNNANDPNLSVLRSRLSGSAVQVIHNPKATAPHIHIQFNRTKLVR